MTSDMEVSMTAIYKHIGDPFPLKHRFFKPILNFSSLLGMI